MSHSKVGLLLNQMLMSHFHSASALKCLSLHFFREQVEDKPTAAGENEKTNTEAHSRGNSDKQPTYRDGGGDG